jgi:ABC-type lipoprotein release transport system permease subunit
MRLVVSSLWGVKPLDAPRIVGVAVGVLAMTVAASAIPAWRVQRLNPADTLLAE